MLCLVLHMVLQMMVRVMIDQLAIQPYVGPTNLRLYSGIAL